MTFLNWSAFVKVTGKKYNGVFIVYHVSSFVKHGILFHSVNINMWIYIAISSKKNISQKSWHAKV